MRVIAGSRRHLLLKTVPGMAVRPTTDRTKETLFNVLAPRLADCRFLDLFSGSGGIGIEALSRGAAETVFVECDRQALSCIKDNLTSTKLLAEAQVLGMDVLAAVERLAAEGKPFDIIFMDPPYNKEWERHVLERLAVSPLVTEDTLLVVEASRETDFSYLPELGLEIVKEKHYKNNQHIFIQRMERKPV